MAQDPARYKIFQESFSQCLKLGVYEDHANRENIIPLLRYYSSKSGDDMVGFDDYISRMKPGQRHILYITGRTKRDAARSPYIEGLRKEGFEILYMFDPVDEYAVQFLKEYRGNELMSCMNVQAARLLDHRTDEDFKAELNPVRRRIEAVLAGKVRSVRLGKAPNGGDSIGRVVPSPDPIDVGLPTLELYFKHGLLRELAKRPDEDPELPHIAEFLLQASELDGAEVDDPRRDIVAERSQALVQRLTAGDRDANGEDLPPLGGRPAPAVDLSMGAKAKGKDGELLSCGSAVRVIKADRARRAIVTFCDEDAGTVDVMYPKWGGGEEEEEGVKKKAVQKLLDFELATGLLKDGNAQAFKDNFFKAVSAVKEEGNQLFKLKDCEAAHERYSVGIDAFCKRPCSQGQQVLAISRRNNVPQLVSSSVASRDAEGTCELRSGDEVPASDLLPVMQELLPLQTSLFMNRARCRQNLELHMEAVQDLTAVLALWQTCDRRMLEADPEMKEAEAKGRYTAEYLRAKSRLPLGHLKQASQDVKDALARNPPATTVKQLRELKVDVQKAQEKHREMNGPIAKELAKVAIGLRGGPKIS